MVNSILKTGGIADPGLLQLSEEATQMRKLGIDIESVGILLRSLSLLDVKEILYELHTTNNISLQTLAEIYSHYPYQARVLKDQEGVATLYHEKEYWQTQMEFAIPAREATVGLDINSVLLKANVFKFILHVHPVFGLA